MYRPISVEDVTEFLRLSEKMLRYGPKTLNSDEQERFKKLEYIQGYDIPDILLQEIDRLRRKRDLKTLIWRTIFCLFAILPLVVWVVVQSAPWHVVFPAVFSFWILTTCVDSLLEKEIIN